MNESINDLIILDPRLSLHICLQIQTPRYWIVSVHHPIDDNHLLRSQVGDDRALVVRIVMWGADGMIDDVREQLIELAPPGASLAFYEALHQILHCLDPAKVASLMPYDLLSRRVLSAALLRNARTVEDYTRALSTRGRLGAYVHAS